MNYLNLISNCLSLCSLRLRGEISIAPAGRSYSHFNYSRFTLHSSVTQPSEAFFTSLMYLYRVPLVAL